MPVYSISLTSCCEFTLNDYTYTISGTYKQTIINEEGCDSTITLNLTIRGNIATNIAKSICQGESFEGYYQAGTYTDTYTSSNGCDSIRTLTLTLVNKPSPNLGDDLLLCKGDSISLYPGQFDSYTWQNGSQQDRLLVKEAGMYSVTVKGACGVASDAIIIKAGPCGVFFPSAFTPNNDGVNDSFITPARNDFFSFYHLVIYNRWGQKIFESKDPSKGWDGKVNGVMQTADTFVWACTFTIKDNGVKDSKNGTVTLLR
jgi:gliding motility-associated-like protein